MLGYVLTAGDMASWWSFAAIAYARLARRERMALAYAALMSLDEDDAQAVAEAVWEVAP